MNKILIAAIAMALFGCKNQMKNTGDLETLTSPADSVSAEPYLFTNPDGVVYLSWVEKTKDKSTLKFATLNKGQWSKPAVICSGNNWFVNWADYPVLAVSQNGSMAAHYLEKSENSKYTYDVKMITSSNAGNKWDTARLLNEDGKKAEHGFVSIVPYQENYFVAWLDGRNAGSEEEAGHSGGHEGQMTLRGAVVTKNGSKVSEWELDNRVCDCCQTTAAITSKGPVVIYRDRSQDEIRDISIVRYVNGEWTSPKTVFQDNWKIAGCPVNGPRVDAQDNNLALAWFSSPDKKGQVSVIFSADGGASFGNPVRVDEGQGIGRVDVILLDDKTAMVSWMEGSAIKAAKIHNNGKKEPSITIASTSESRSSGFPQMTKSGNTVFFAWTDDSAKKVQMGSIDLSH